MRYQTLIPVLLAALLAFSGCKEIKDPEFRRLEHFGVKNMNLNEATIGFGVTYFNPNNFGVSVKEAEANVYLDSVYIGRFVQDSLVEVQKNSAFTVPFSGAVSLQTALKLNLNDLVNKQVMVKADGTVKVGKAGIYVSKPVHYQGLHRLEELNLKF
jgi:LEA14-like dessication related protein